MFKSKYIKTSLALSSMILLISCGGSSSSSNNEDDSSSVNAETANHKPIANAGEDQNVSFGNSIVLDGIKSSDEDDETLDYTWSLNSKIIAKKSSIVLENLAEGTYVYTLTVKDKSNATSSDSIEVRTYADSVIKLKTNQGDILLKMMTSIAPKAVENFVTHSKNNYYDGVTFHRVIKDFMIQGGDPTGTGTGGESIWGEYFPNEIDSNIKFDKPFLLAMANAGGTKTNGSQFFITTKEYSSLNGKYTIFGEVIDGSETVNKIENVATGAKDKPKGNQTILNASSYFEIK